MPDITKTGRAGRLARRLLWFVALWGCGVIAVLAASGMLRALLSVAR